MKKNQIVKFLRMGAKIRHISWEPNQYIHFLYGYVVTQDWRTFTMEEFLKVFSNPFYADGWCFSDPFREMAEHTVNDDTDELAIHEMEQYLRKTFCDDICGPLTTTQPEQEAISNFWHGTTGMYRLQDAEGNDYLYKHTYSEECIAGFAKKLMSLNIIKDPSSLVAVPA